MSDKVVRWVPTADRTYIRVLARFGVRAAWLMAAEEEIVFSREMKWVQRFCMFVGGLWGVDGLVAGWLDRWRKAELCELW
jgi:hypothetical protein